jgi:parvulin-like peptidyl-prolyl isomerase
MMYSNSRAVHSTARFVSALFVSAFLFIGCSTEVPSIDTDDRVLAQVNDDVVTVSWFERTYVNFLIQTGGEDSQVNRKIHLDNLIDAILLSDEFLKRGMDTDSSYLAFKDRKKRSIVAERYFDEAFLKTLVAPDEAELRRAFALSKDQVVVRHLFFMNKKAADDSYARLEEGRPFLEEAQYVYKTASFDSSAGYLGPVKYFSVDDAFGEAAFSLEKGQYSQPVRSRYGYHIILAENKIVEPLLTESEYQTKRSGISSQFRLRKRRLEGDTFVRSFMEEKQVESNPKAILALQSLLQDFALQVNPRPNVVTAGDSNFEVDSLRRSLAPETILATYEWNGRREPFTAGDFIFWLEDLPFQEALNRTAASVGRAMRNELLARAGEELGFEDGYARALLDRDLMQQRSTLMRRYFREHPVQDIDEDLIRRAFESNGLDREEQYRVDASWIVFKTFAEAESVAKLLAQYPDRMSQYDGFSEVTSTHMYDVPDLSQHIRGAEVGKHLVVGLKEGWAVLFVAKKEREELDWEKNRAAIVQQLAPFAAEYEVVAELRAKADIRIEYELFEGIQAR